MLLLSYLFLTWSLLNAFFVLSTLFGSWMSEEKMAMNMKNHTHLLFLSLSFGSFFFFLNHKDYLISGLSMLVGLVLLGPLVKDMFLFYTTSPWDWEGEMEKVKQIIPYYNPRLYVLTISLFLGVVVLLWQPLDDFLSWEILLGVVALYYLGSLILLSRTKRYNFFRQGLDENSWEEFEKLPPRKDVYAIIYYLIKGFSSWQVIKASCPFIGLPLKHENKLLAMQKFHDSFKDFVEEFSIILPLISASLSRKEKLYILVALESYPLAFDLMWTTLLKQESLDEDFLWSKIKKEKLISNIVEVEKLIFLLKDSDDKDALIESLHLLKRQKLQSLELLWTNRDDLVITEADYQRSSPHDRLFLKKYKMELFRLFDNSCIKSKLNEEIEIDHFFLPKSQGGSFLMQRKDGIWVVNAVILNKKYNIQKGVKKIEDFFSIEELMLINSKLKQLALKINDELLGDI